ncbi:glycosyltransferase family 1 protein [Paenibacillus arenilitoris]|uniref:Glycosyltransferase family 1 protein n=1 Tax=Paenibacillus arenilitoris TaxID=2772299 RepID=A0A927CRW5_9BACL|nr:glycosyltransferase family 1 protein [Paenibacillus arenilitoris]MBD2872047.1 glycosyltransferase family 1 protein [Paenibacillus arenilitoris]
MGGPIKILHAAVNMNRGGAETLIMNLYRHIDRTKLQFDFLTCKPGVFDEEIERLGGRIHRIPHITDVGHRGYVRALRRFFAEHGDYPIVHAHMDRMSGLVLRAARGANIPVRIAHSHNTRSEGGLLARLYKRYAGAHIRYSATHRIACSDAAARWLFGGRAASARIMRNGIACERFAYSPEVRSALRSELGVREGTLAIGHVGRFVHQKNHAQLVELFGEVRRRRPDSVLLLAGDGPLRPAIEQRARELGLADNVRLLGVRSDIDRLMQAFDVFVFPSLHEGLPVTLVEAQGAGLPCVISDAVTPEVDMGIGLVRFFPLRELTRGVEHVLEAAEQRGRIIPPAALARKGYDIKQAAREAAAFYLSHFEVNHEDVNRVYAHL